MKQDERLMDFKTDILLNIPHFLEQLNNSENDEGTLNAFRPNRTNKGQFKVRKQEFRARAYCRMCYLSKQSRDTFMSHNFGDLSCPSLTARDRKKFFEAAKLSSIQEEADDTEIDEDEIAEMFGYGQMGTTANDSEASQVEMISPKLQHKIYHPRNEELSCGYI